MGISVGGKEGDIQAVFPHFPFQEQQIFLIVSVRAVFVFDLTHKNRTAVGALILGKLWNQHLKIIVHLFQVSLVGTAQGKIAILQQPRRKSAKFPFGTDELAGADDHEKTEIRGGLNKAFHVGNPLEIELTFPWLVKIPGHVGFHRIESAGLQLQQAVAPIFGNGTEIMDRAGNNLQGFSVQFKAVFFDKEFGHRYLQNSTRLR